MAICTVTETKQLWGDEDDFRILTPNIGIEMKPELERNETVNCALSLTNPLDLSLTTCSFNVAGPGVIKKTIRMPFRDIRPKESIRITVPVTGYEKGQFKIVATFTSKQLSDVTGSLVVNVL